MPRHNRHPEAPFLKIEPRPVGRPPLPPGERLHVYTIRLNEDNHAKLKALGGREWVERQLSRVTNLKPAR